MFRQYQWAGIALCLVLVVAVVGCECGGASYYTAYDSSYDQLSPQAAYNRALAEYNSAAADATVAGTANQIRSVLPVTDKTGLLLSLLGGAASHAIQSDAQQRMDMARMRLLQAQARLNQASGQD